MKKVKEKKRKGEREKRKNSTHCYKIKLMVGDHGYLPHRLECLSGRGVRNLSQRWHIRFVGWLAKWSADIILSPVG